MRYAMTSVVVGVFLLLAVVPASHGGNFFDVSDNGNVGIGTTTAGALLDVARPATTSNTELIDIRANGFTQTIAGALTNARFNQFNQYTLSAATAQTVTNGTTLHIAGPPTGGGAGPASITTSSALRIAGGTVANTTSTYGLYVDAPTGATNNYAAVFPTGNVGIGTTNPNTQLTIQRPVLDTSIVNSGATAGMTIIRGGANYDRLQLGVGLIGGGYQGWIQASYDDGSGSGGVKPLLVNPNGGNVGIGTTSPGAKLQVTGGDAAVTTQGNGLILRATDGSNCFRVTVNNSGTLSTSSVTCP